MIIMKKLSNLIAVSLLALPSILASGPGAQAGEANPAYLPYIAQSLQAGNELDDYLNRLPDMIKRYDSDDNGLDANDIRRENQRQFARRRANIASTLLRLDLNADNKVTREEAKEASPIYGRDRQMNQLMLSDVNHDGVVTLDEALANVKPGENCSNNLTYPALLLTADTNKDGHLTAEELKGIGTTIFKTYDDNNDGVISTTEYTAHRNQFRRTGAVSSGQCVTR